MIWFIVGLVIGYYIHKKAAEVRAYQAANDELNETINKLQTSFTKSE